MGLFKRLSVLDALNSYLTDNHDEEEANDYRVLFAKVLNDYDWNQPRKSKLLDKLDEKFSSYKNGHTDMIDVLRKGEKKSYLKTTLKIHNELSMVKKPKDVYIDDDEKEKYANKIYNKLEYLIKNYFEK